MSFLGKPRSVPEPNVESDAGAREAEGAGPASESQRAEEIVQGERGIPSVNRARSLQSRMSSILAVGLMSALGLGLLSFYYAGAITRQSRAQASAQSAVKSRAQGEMTLPSLGHIEPPAVRSDRPGVEEGHTAGQRLFGPPPPLPSEPESNAWNRADPLVQDPSDYGAARPSG
ncbi:MAG TPA: hypothetical protein VGI23_00550, partial [Steroidobacteraceae bacterium]